MINQFHKSIIDENNLQKLYLIMIGDLNALNGAINNGQFVLFVNGQQAMQQQMVALQQQMVASQENQQAMQQQIEANQQAMQQQMVALQQAMQQQILASQQAMQQHILASQQAMQQQMQDANMAFAITLNNIQQQFVHLGHPQMTVAERNHLHRLSNRTCDCGAAIRAIIRDDGLVPDNFPATKNELNQLIGPQLNPLLQFYGLDVPNAVSDRRVRLLLFIEVEPVVN